MSCPTEPVLLLADPDGRPSAEKNQPPKLSSSPTFKRHLAYGALSGLACWIWSQSSLSELALPVGWILWALLLGNWGWRRGCTSPGPLTTPTLLACTTTISAFGDSPLAWKLAIALYLLMRLSCLIKSPLRLLLAGASLGLAAGLDPLTCLGCYGLTFLGMAYRSRKKRHHTTFLNVSASIAEMAPALVALWVFLQALNQAPDWNIATRIQMDYLFFWLQQPQPWLPWLILCWAVLSLLPLHSRRRLVSNLGQGQIWALFCYFQIVLAYALAKPLCSGQDLLLLQLPLAHHLFSPSLLLALLPLSLLGLQLGMQKKPLATGSNLRDLQAQAQVIYLVPVLLLLAGMTWPSISTQPVLATYQRLQHFRPNRLHLPQWLQRNIIALRVSEGPVPFSSAQVDQATQEFLTRFRALSPQERETWAEYLAERLDLCARLQLLSGNTQQALAHCLEAQRLYPSPNWDYTSTIEVLLQSDKLSELQLQQVERAWAPPVQANRKSGQIWSLWLKELQSWPAELEAYRQYQLDQSLIFRQLDHYSPGESSNWDTLATTGNQKLAYYRDRQLQRSGDRLAILLTVNLIRYRRIHGRLPQAWADFQPNLPPDLQAQLGYNVSCQRLRHCFGEGEYCQITLNRKIGHQIDSLILQLP